MVILIIENDIFLQLEVTEVFAKSTIAPVYSLSDVNQIVILFFKSYALYLLEMCNIKFKDLYFVFSAESSCFVFADI
jgi:hypothetical protein